MLKVLRKRKRSWIIFLILGAIILVFIFWGIGSLRVDKGIIAARVNGKPITAAEYAAAYQQQINYYRNIFKDQFTDELLEKMNLKQNTIQMLINTKLELQEAKRQGISVSDEEVQQKIQAVQMFQRDGTFSKELYLQVLRANRILPGEYERDIRNSLIIEKLQNKITDTITITDKEAEDSFAGESKKINLQYIAVDPAKFEKDVHVTDEDARAYFEKNKIAFKAPVMIKAAYISIPFKDILQKVQISEADIKKYYEKNSNEFQTKREVSASHIFIKQGAKKDEARKKAKEVLALAQKGGNFAELAKKYSDDKASGIQGGLIGYFKQGDMIKSFEDAAFSLKKGEISDIVETNLGYHIIKVNDIKEARLKPFKEAKDAIAKKLKDAGAKKLASDIASEIHGTVTIGKKDLKDAAAQTNLKLTETVFFSENNADIELVRNKELKNAAFSMKAGETSGILETASGVYIIKIHDRKEEHIPTYEEAAGSVKMAVAKEKAKEKAKEAADAVLKRLKQGEDLQKLASKEGYAAGETGLFAKIDGYIANIGLRIGDKQDIFSLTPDNPYYNQALEHGNKFYIFKLKHSKEADKAEFEARKADIKNRMLQQKREEALNKWMSELRSKAKIEINKEVL